MREKNAVCQEGRRVNTRWYIANLATILFKKNDNMLSLARKVI